MLRPYGIFDSFRRRHGPCFTLRIPGDPPRLVVSDPELIEAIIRLPEEAFRFDTQSFPIDMGRRSILFTDGQEHRRKRRHIGPTLGGRALAGHQERMRDIADDMIDGWLPGTERVLAPDMRAVTLQTFVQTTLGPRTPDTIRDGLLMWTEASLAPVMMAVSMAISPVGTRHLLADTLDRLREGRLTWLQRRTPWAHLAERKRALVDDVLALVRRRRGQDAPGKELVDRLLQAGAADGDGMDDDDVATQILTLMIGGYETTTQSLCWCLWFLLTHPDALRRARDEALEGDSTPWLDACIKESMRLRPIAPAVNRHLTRDVTLGGLHVPEGTILWPSSYLVQRDSELWEEPLEFRPSRWLATPRVPQGRYFPWGFGQRSCLGAAFATSEMRAVLGQLLRRVDLRIREPSGRAAFRGISVGLRSGLPVAIDAVRPRKPAARAG